MKKLFFTLLLLIPATAYYYFYAARSSHLERPTYHVVHDIAALFPSTAAEMRQQADAAKADASKGLEAIYAIKPECRTFNNTIVALDLIQEKFGVVSSSINILNELSPDEDVRKAAQEMTSDLDRFTVDHFSQNEKLFHACLEYEKSLQDRDFATQECLTKQQMHYLEEIMKGFRRSGMELPAQTREKVKKLQKEIAECSLAFSLVISTANKEIKLSKDKLKGVPEMFLQGLKQENGLYIIPLTAANTDEIMRSCDIEETRKALYKEAMQQCYPENEKNLLELIRLRDELAKALGYESYAHLEIEPTMAKNPATVEQFLTSLIDKAQAKAALEMKELKKNLPKGISLTKEGLFNPWDFVYVRNAYKKSHFDIDEFEISNYFPLEHTLQALLSIYEKFFGLCFKKMDVSRAGLWHKDVELLAVYKDGVYRGAVLLDLFPRKNKYTHAAAAPIVPSVIGNGGKIHPGVVIMMTNFPAPQKDRPSLLKRRDVVTFFHEFGHAIHSLLGATPLAGTSGCQVKMDFVEMPSQMLESWMYDPEILKMVSKHHKTGEPLSDTLIQKIRDSKNYDAGDFLCGQLHLAFSSLNFHKEGAKKDLARMWLESVKKMRPYIAPSHYNKYFCSFGHLGQYASRYYGYLWSQVFALDLFKYIEQYGLLDRAIGERYINEIIGKGGSEDPADMLRKFLGREPNSDAFFEDLGL